MGRPAKIRKKKSFMFTTRHYSFMSIVGILIAVLGICVGVTMVVHSYYSAGNVDVGFGGVGLFSALLSVTGILCGVTSLRERDIYITPAIVAIVLNGLLILGWLVMIVISILA